MLAVASTRLPVYDSVDACGSRCCCCKVLLLLVLLQLLLLLLLPPLPLPLPLPLLPLLPLAGPLLTIRPLGHFGMVSLSGHRFPKSVDPELFSSHPASSSVAKRCVSHEVKTGYLLGPGPATCFASKQDVLRVTTGEVCQWANSNVDDRMQA